MTDLLTISLVALVCMVLVHLFSTLYSLAEGRYRGIWLSLAGGVSVAYVFVRVLPDLGRHDEVIATLFPQRLPYLDYHGYLVALYGLAFFYGLDRLALADHRQRQVDDPAKGSDRFVFWIHIGSFATVNLLVGYLLLRREHGSAQNLVIFAVAMIFYLFVTDNSLHAHHPAAFKRVGRYVLAASVTAGWLIGLSTELRETTIALLFAFLAGGVILNVLKEELPAEGKSRYWAFLVGMTAYSALLVAI